MEEDGGGCRSLSMASSPSTKLRVSKFEGVRALLLNGYTIFQKKKVIISLFHYKKKIRNKILGEINHGIA